MFPWQQPGQALKSALFLSSLDDGSSVDRAALRQVGVARLHSVSSGERALEIIRSRAAEKTPLAVDFIVCAGVLSDMSLSDFLQKFSGLDSLFPVMVISSRQDEVSMALGQGADVALGRPYSLNELARALESMRSRAVFQPGPQKKAFATAGAPVCAAGQAKQQCGAAAPTAPAPELASASPVYSKQATPEQAATASEMPAAHPGAVQQTPPPATATASKVPPIRLEKAAQALPEPAASVPNSLLWTHTGLSLLKQGKTEAARKFLIDSLNHDPLDLEAALGLSRLHQQEGDEARAQRWLHRAAWICFGTHQYERAELLFSRLPEKWQGDHELIEARELLLEGNYNAACETFINICAKRADLPLHRLLGRACQFTPAPEECLQRLLAAMRRNGYASTARTLEIRLFGSRAADSFEFGGLFAHFPRLQEVLAVARFTAQAFRAV